MSKLNLIGFIKKMYVENALDYRLFLDIKTVAQTFSYLKLDGNLLEINSHENFICVILCLPRTKLAWIIII